MGTNENSKNIHILHDVTLEERENLREKKKKIKVVFAWYYEDM